MRVAHLSTAFTFLLAAFAVVAREDLSRRAIFPGAALALPSSGEAARLWRGSVRLEYPSADGTRLAALFLPARGEPSAAVTYFHATNQSAGDALHLARDLASRGMDVCLPEHRGYGGLAGTPTVAKIVEDGRAAIAACPSRAPRRVIAGRSLGASVAAAMAREGRADALVLLSPFTSMDDAAGPFAWALAAEDRIDVRAALRGLDVPVVVLHGTRDALIPMRMGEAVASAAPRGRFVALEGSGHNDLSLGRARDRVLSEIAAVASPAAMSGVIASAP